MGKYESLGTFLREQRAQEVLLTFNEIEKITGVKLPPKAQHHRAWWSNNPSNNVMTKVWLEAGFETVKTFIRSAWGDRVSRRDSAPLHPKSALQEWAAANDKRAPAYEVIGRSGPQHAPTFVVKVSIRGVGEAEAEGLTKQEAETEAAQALLEQLS